MSIEDPLVEKLKILEKNSRKLEITADDRKVLNNRVEHLANDFLEDLPTTKTYSLSRPQKAPFKIKDESVEIEKILRVIKTEVFPHGINAASGGHLGYIPGGGIYASALGD